MHKFIAAAVQMDTQNDKTQNMIQMAEYIDEAVSKGAQLIVFPEVVNILSELPEHAETIPGPATELLSSKAKEHSVWTHGGSISEINPNGDRTYNTSVLVAPDGGIRAEYRKLHNFDMILLDGSSVRESDNK
ncbi:MAG: carbon-nitrogen hydrolase family protein, partial [Peptococcaceae bacterium]|nr:carbon-nitrogen hydrolase family protein [Peptococcaceae bacterium]